MQIETLDESSVYPSKHSKTESSTTTESDKDNYSRKKSNENNIKNISNNINSNSSSDKELSNELLPIELFPIGRPLSPFIKGDVYENMDVTPSEGITKPSTPSF